MTKKLLTLFTDESVIIFIFYMANKLIVVKFSALGHSLDIFQRDFALEIMVFYVREIMRGQKEVADLFHIETIKLDDLDREYNMLIFFKLILDFNVLFEVKVIISQRNWLWFSACCFVGRYHLLSTNSLLLKLIISLKNVINQENNLWWLCERSNTSDWHIKRKQILREGSTYTRRVCCRWGQSDAQMLNMEVSSYML